MTSPKRQRRRGPPAHPVYRFAATMRSEAVLYAEGDVVRFGQRIAQIDAEAAEARILETQAENRAHVVAQADAVVQAVSTEARDDAASHARAPQGRSRPRAA